MSQRFHLYWNKFMLLRLINCRFITDIITIISNLSNAVYFFVHLGAMVISFLTSTSDRKRYPRRMPRANARNLSQTLVRLALKFARVPSRRHSYKPQQRMLSHSYILTHQLISTSRAFRLILHYPPQQHDYIRFWHQLPQHIRCFYGNHNILLKCHFVIKLLCVVH